MVLVEPRICEKGGKNFLPLLGDTECEWSPVLRFILYLVGLGWCFLGVGIASDLFMGAIEKITSKTKQVHVPNEHRKRTCKVWNPTVANLTLMALGSSAPEILLSVIELLTNEFYAGDLGPSTIVGSAAFNLLVIIAVCVYAIPDGEGRHISELPVYYVTAASSLLAYMWLVVILMLTSPNVVEVWEGILTFLFFPALVVLAFAADKGWLTGKKGHAPTIHPSALSKDELAEAIAKIKSRYTGAKTQPTEEEILKIVSIEYAPDASRAKHRKGAMRKILGGHADKHVLKRSATQRMADAARKLSSPKAARVSPEPESLLPVEDEVPRVYFQSAKYGVPEHCETVEVVALRSGPLDEEVCVGYHTEDGTARAGSDYIAPEKGATVTFPGGEGRAVIAIRILDDNACENDETFFVVIDPPADIPRADGAAPPQGGAAAGPRYEAGEIRRAEVTIIDDDKSPTIEFGQDTVKVALMAQTETPMDADVVVTRTGRMRAELKCKVKTVDGTAVAGKDYVPIPEETEVTFGKGQMSASVKVQIIADSRYEDAVSFDVVLTDPSEGCSFNPKTEGGEDADICHVEISLDEGAKKFVDMVQAKLKNARSSFNEADGTWLSQFADLRSPEADDDEEPTTAWAWFMHIITLPWQFFGALVPPVDYCDGWLAFVCSLLYIGLITAIVGDLAALVGCVTGVIPDSVTAITLVALGTSLPDTFASMQAALQDSHADASIGNVTGSNSVNVFLGLGMPWTIGSIYWTVGGSNAKWGAKYAHLLQSGDVASRFHGGAFVVEAGTLASTIAVFVCCACICIFILWLRRKMFGCELGGPGVPKKVTSAVLVSLWVIYVVAASIIAIMNES